MMQTFRSYEEIWEKLKPLYKEQPERLGLFYNRVYLFLQSIKPGACIEISKYCKPESKELFVDVAELCMIEERWHQGSEAGWMEFNADRSVIIREPRCDAPLPRREPTPYERFYGNKKTNQSLNYAEKRK